MEEPFPDGSALPEDSHTKFKLNWTTLPVDIIWDRVYSKFLNTWLVFLALMLMLLLASANIIDNPFPTKASLWMGDVVIYQLLLIVGTAATITISPFMFANGHDQFRKSSSITILALFPIACGISFTLFWVYVRKSSHAIFPLFFWLSALTGCGCFMFYYIHILFLTKHKEPYMEKHQRRNERYVRSLLGGWRRRSHQQQEGAGGETRDCEQGAAIPSAPSFVECHLHPIFEAVAMAPAVAASDGEGEGPEKERERGESELAEGYLLRNRTTSVKTQRPHVFVFPDSDPLPEVEHEEQSAQEFFLSIVYSGRGAAVWRDIRKNTPQLMILGTVIGAMAVGYIVGCTFKYMYIETKWERLYDRFEDATEDLEAYIDSVYDLQDSIADLKDSTIFTRSGNVSSSVNETYAIAQIDYYLQQLGYDVTMEDLQRTNESLANLTDAAETTATYFGELDDAYADFKRRIRGYKDEYNELKWAWNGCLIAASVIASLVSAASLLWPVAMAANTRHNLRTGKWRLNKRAYPSSYFVHSLTEVPGTIFGVAAVSHVLLVLVLAVVLFLVVYSPIRDFIWRYFKQFIVSFLCAIAFKNALVYLLFRVGLLDSEGRIKNMHTYSVAFMVILFFNVVYGVLGGIIRLALFFSYSFVANLRIDTTMLPTPVWHMDSAFTAYNAYLLYEHEHKNPVMRTAVEAFAGSYGYSSTGDIGDSLSSGQMRARTRWFLAYTLIHNPSLIPMRRKAPPLSGTRAAEESHLKERREEEAGGLEEEAEVEGIVMSEMHRT